MQYLSCSDDFGMNSWPREFDYLYDTRVWNLNASSWDLCLISTQIRFVHCIRGLDLYRKSINAYVTNFDNIYDFLVTEGSWRKHMNSYLTCMLNLLKMSG